MDYSKNKRQKKLRKVQTKTATRTLSIIIIVVTGFLLATGMYLLVNAMYEQPEKAIKIQSCLEWSSEKLTNYIPPRTAHWFGNVEFIK